MSPRRILPTVLLTALILAAPAQARPLPADPPGIAAHPRAEVRHRFPWEDAAAAVGAAVVAASLLGRRRRVAA
jgi:uncharacterized protein (TIGR03382 family)